MDKAEKVLVGLAGILLLGFFWMVVDVCTSTTTIEHESRRFDIYHCTAPFGIIWVESSADGCFLFIAGSYSMDMALSEDYIVKYFSGEKLKTKIFKSTTTSVIPDGKFYLEQQWWVKRTYNMFGKLTRIDDSRKNDFEDKVEDYWDVWIIHIPELPKLNQTISKEWIFLDS